MEVLDLSLETLSITISNQFIVSQPLTATVISSLLQFHHYFIIHSTTKLLASREKLLQL